MNKLNLSNKVTNTPASPGVYMMLDIAGTILYVGKASSLRNRLRSYFSPAYHDNPKISKLVSVISDFDVIITESEQEALILECNLIKQHQPRFNSRLKDDKTYPYIKIDVSEDFPQVYITRNVDYKDGAKYFGPYASAGSVRRTLTLLKKLFPYRSCTKLITGTDDRACLDYHINRCVAPCIGVVNKKQYAEVIEQVEMFLKGNTADILKTLNKKMLKAAEDMHFEKATILRDQIQAIGSVHEKQKVISNKSEDMDVIACQVESKEAWVEIFFVRSGKLIGRDHYLMNIGDTDSISEIQVAFIKQFYDVASEVPPVLLLQASIPSNMKSDLELLLTSKRKGTISLINPIRGSKKKLIDMVLQNASQGMKHLVANRYINTDRNTNAVYQLQDALNLPKPPVRIECYDISNIQGTNPVGSMVVFESGSPKNSDYRRFQIKNIVGIDDYAMMKEMLTRRFKKLHKTNNNTKSTWTNIPDLVLIDGGKGHLSSAIQVFLELGIYGDIPIASLAKHNEELFVPYTPEPIVMPKNSLGLFLVQRARDEAHRFAITYHRNKRSKNSLKSSLDLIEGIGPIRRKKLLKKFGSVKKIKATTLEDITTISGITYAIAKNIKDQI
jgi:excinuclease ABC subunit C